jgi:hypothetical protein
MNLTRQQLASVFKDPQMVRAFESLFERSEVVIPEGIQEAVDLAGEADENAQRANDALAALGSEQMFILSDDITASSDVLIDSGLTAQVLISRPVSFEATMFYEADTSATGSRWTVSGPSTTFLAYFSKWALTTTSNTEGNYAAYDQPGAANASSANAAGNVAYIKGMLIPDDDGVLSVRFAAETGGTITAKAGSFLLIRNLY